MRVAAVIASVVVALPLAGCGLVTGSDKISNKQMSEAFGRSMSDRTFGAFNLNSPAARRELREARKKNEGIEANALASDITRVMVFNGMANGLFTLKPRNASPWFGFTYAEPGWKWFEKAMEKDAPPALELDVKGVKNLECFTSDEGVRRCAGDVRFRIRPSGHWKKVLGNFSTAEFEGRPVFVKTLESGEWRIGAWGKAPERIGKGADDEDDAGVERDDPGALMKAIVAAMNAEMGRASAKSAIEQIGAILRPRYNQTHVGVAAQAAAADQRLGLFATADPSGKALTVTRMYATPIQIAVGGKVNSAWAGLQSCWALNAAGHTDWRLLTPAELAQLTRPQEAFDQSYEAWTEALIGRPLVAPDKDGAIPGRVDDMWRAGGAFASTAPVPAEPAAAPTSFAPSGGRMIFAGPVWRFLRPTAGTGGYLIVGDAMAIGPSGVFGPLIETPGAAAQPTINVQARTLGADGALRYAGLRSGGQPAVSQVFPSERKAVALCARAA